MFCKYCGAELADEAKFCKECGKPVSKETLEAVAAAKLGSSAAGPAPATGPEPKAAPVPRTAPVPEKAPVSNASTPTRPNVKPTSPQQPLGEYRTVSTANGKRSEVFFACSGLPDDAVAAAERVLVSSRFKQKTYRGEQVWKKGTGVATAMQYVTVASADGCIRVQGWVQVGLGDAGFSEMPLTGLVGAAPKKSCKRTIEKIRKGL